MIENVFQSKYSVELENIRKSEVEKSGDYGGCFNNSNFYFLNCSITKVSLCAVLFSDRRWSFISFAIQAYSQYFLHLAGQEIVRSNCQLLFHLILYTSKPRSSLTILCTFSILCHWRLPFLAVLLVDNVKEIYKKKESIFFQTILPLNCLKKFFMMARYSILSFLMNNANNPSTV